MKKISIVRTATVAISLDLHLKGQLKYLNHFFSITAVSGDDVHLENVSNREGVRVVGIRMVRDIDFIQDIISLWKLFLFFKRDKPSIVHSITPKAGLLTMIASKLAGVPIRVHTFTGLLFPTEKGFRRFLLITLDKLLCLAATHVYPEGHGVMNDLISNKITKKPLKVLANGNINGVDLAFFRRENILPDILSNLKSDLGINCKDFVFVYVGRLVQDKGVFELLNAFRYYSYHNMKLLLVGNFDNESSKWSKEVRLSFEADKRIIYTGYKVDIRPYLALSDCLVLPSYREGFPNVVLQAGAMGLPCIVSNVNGCNEIIVNGLNGIIIPPKSIGELGEAMREIYDKPTLRSRFQLEARRIIEARFSQEVIWSALKEEYSNLCALKEL